LCHASLRPSLSVVFSQAIPLPCSIGGFRSQTMERLIPPMCLGWERMSEEIAHCRFPQTSRWRQTRQLGLLVAFDADSARYSCGHTLPIASLLEKPSELGPAQRPVAFLPRGCKPCNSPDGSRES